MFVNRVGFEKDTKKTFARKYRIQASTGNFFVPLFHFFSDESFFEGSRADIYIDDQKIGVFGVVHPQVLLNYEIPFPCVALEMTIECFV